MPRAPLRADAMQLLAMDDAPDPFDARMETPRGVSIELENVPAGPGNTAARRYARITVGEGESPEQARARLVAWAETQAMPSGDRVLTGAALEHDEDRGVTEQVGSGRTS